MLPPHQPKRRKKLAVSQPVRASKAKAKALDTTEAGDARHVLRVLQRRAPVSVVAAMRTRRQAAC